MSTHSYSRCWLHVVWSTLRRDCDLDEESRKKVSHYLQEYAKSKSIYTEINYVNADHVHVLIDLPTNRSVEEVLHLLKGSSSHWINENHLTPFAFSWGRGYGSFSVSDSIVPKVTLYIAGQAEHHRRRTFLEEYKHFVIANRIKWHEDRQDTGGTD